MNANWVIIGIVSVLGLWLVVYLFRRNWRDKENLEQFYQKNDMLDAKDLEEDEPNNLR